MSKMKYLKTYEGMENEIPDSPERKEIINTINDICLDLQDDGFIVRNEGMDSDIYGRYERTIRIIIHKESQEYIPYKDISNTIERLINFMKSSGYYYHVYHYRNGWYGEVDINTRSKWFLVAFNI